MSKSLLNSHSSDGFTIVELLVATAMMIIVTAAAVTMLVSAMDRQPKVSEGAQQIGTARNAVEKIVKDVRQGSTISLASATGLTLSTYCGSGSGPAPCQVTYTCTQESGRTTYRCTRAVGSEPAAIVVRGLGSGDVFSYVPSTGTPRYVGVRVELPAGSGNNQTVLENGAALHNATSYLSGS